MTHPWAGKTVLVGVTGSIAIFKACELVSQIRQRGAEVHVVMTPHAVRLISPLTFHALSGNPVVVDLFTPKRHPLDHLRLAEKADAFLVVPATANILAKLALGVADDALTTTALACYAPLIIAPAMETKMWMHPATQQHVRALRERGALFVGPHEGPLASGKRGVGRLAEVEEILTVLEKALFSRRDLEGLKVLVTAGATREPIDTIRFISNPSSGKMGVAVAQVARERGAEVVLVAGHMEVPPPEGVTVVRVKTAKEMTEAVLGYAHWFDVLVSVAAIADFTPKRPIEGKIRRQGKKSLLLELEPTPDLLATVRQKRRDAFLVGFAAEVGSPLKGAEEKMRRKGLDLIVANDVTQPGSGFGTDTNECFFLDRNGGREKLPPLLKQEVAHRLWDKIAVMLLGEGVSRR